LNPYLVISILVILVVGILTTSTISDQFVDANSRKKIHFTQTITSVQDPGQGHEGHESERETIRGQGAGKSRAQGSGGRVHLAAGIEG